MLTSIAFVALLSTSSTNVGAPTNSTNHAAVVAQDANAQGRPDLLVVKGRRDAETPVAGTIIEASLDQVVIEVAGEEKSYKADRVVRLQVNRVPTAFSDGEKHMKARRYAEAAAAYESVARTTSLREPVRAAAQLEAVRALVALSGSDASALGRARELASGFASSFPEARDLPEARRLAARIAHLAGDVGAAIDGYAALMGEFKDGAATVGYDPFLCLEAGLAAAHAALDSNAEARARELFGTLEAAATQLASTIDAADPRAQRAEALRERALLGEGWILLVGKKGTQARSFFQSRVDGDQIRTAQARFEARLGLARSLEAGGEPRAAQVQYASVSATVFADRDLAARALVGLAATALTLADTDSRAAARVWLTEVLERYPDTPSARMAREMIATLG
jgi:outer membrane protein assembly factor BamD (BamD/ComL family)